MPLAVFKDAVGFQKHAPIFLASTWLCLRARLSHTPKRTSFVLTLLGNRRQKISKAPKSAKVRLTVKGVTLTDLAECWVATHKETGVGATKEEPLRVLRKSLHQRIRERASWK